MKKLSGAKYLAIIASVIVVLSVITAIFILDPPGVQRQRRFDARRVEDLRNITYSIDSYWERKKSLPPNLATLESEPGLRAILKDPQSGTAYGYEVTAPKSYKLCAVFALDSSDESRECGKSRKWSHGAGKQCFILRPPDKADKNVD
jgi:hypothetical protein